MFYLDIYDNTDTLLDRGPFFRVHEISHSEHLDEVPEWVFTVPAGDSRIDDTLEDSSAHYAEILYRHPTDGRRSVGYCLLADGERRLVDNPRGKQWRYRLPSLMGELAWGCTFPGHRYDNIDGNSILSNDVIAGDLNGLFHSDYGLSGWDEGTVDALDVMTFEFAGETILECIRKMAEDLGLHFRENASTKRRVDFGAFSDDSGVRITQTSQMVRDSRDNDTIMFIATMEMVEESTIVNWVLPLGSGSDPENQLSLADSNRVTPYTIQSTTGPDGETRYYIKDTTSISSYGERREVLSLRDIVPASDDATDLQRAANQLYDAAVAHLQDHKDPNTTYRCEVVDPGGTTDADLRPGNTAHIVYRGMVTYKGTAYKFVDVDDDLMIVSRQRRWDQSGKYHYTLELSTQERRPGNDGQAFQTLIRRTRAMTLHPQSSFDGVLSGDRITGSVGDANTVGGYAPCEGTADTWLALITIKMTTGDPGSGTQGEFVLNTVDNTLKIYENSAWRSVASW